MAHSQSQRIKVLVCLQVWYEQTFVVFRRWRGFREGRHRGGAEEGGLSGGAAVGGEHAGGAHAARHGPHATLPQRDVRHAQRPALARRRGALPVSVASTSRVNPSSRYTSTSRWVGDCGVVCLCRSIISQKVLPNSKRPIDFNADGILNNSKLSIVNLRNNTSFKQVSICASHVRHQLQTGQCVTQSCTSPVSNR